jgi:hypothetical protein
MREQAPTPTLTGLAAASAGDNENMPSASPADPAAIAMAADGQLSEATDHGVVEAVHPFSEEDAPAAADDGLSTPQTRHTMQITPQQESSSSPASAEEGFPLAEQAEMPVPRSAPAAALPQPLLLRGAGADSVSPRQQRRLSGAQGAVMQIVSMMMPMGMSPDSHIGRAAEAVSPGSMSSSAAGSPVRARGYAAGEYASSARSRERSSPSSPLRQEVSPGSEGGLRPVLTLADILKGIRKQ